MNKGERIMRTSCRGCHGVCQVLVHMDGDRRIGKITGAPESPSVTRKAPSARVLSAPKAPMRLNCYIIRIVYSSPC